MLENYDCDDREYFDATDQIREIFIHKHYLSQKDIEICLDFNIAILSTHKDAGAIQELHNTLTALYGTSDI